MSGCLFLFSSGLARAGGLLSVAQLGADVSDRESEEASLAPLLFGLDVPGRNFFEQVVGADAKHESRYSREGKEVDVVNAYADKYPENQQDCLDRVVRHGFSFSVTLFHKGLLVGWGFFGPLLWIVVRPIEDDGKVW